jgi:hypothetical protein
MNRYFFCFGLHLMVFLWGSIIYAQQVDNVVDFLSWEKVKLETNEAKYENVELDGFIQLEGETAYPLVTLWESREAMKYHRPFMYVIVNSISISPTLLGSDQAPPARWKSLDGKYVRIRGVFRDQEKGCDYIGLGRFEKVFDITVTMEDGKQVRYTMSEKSTEPPKGDK